MANEAPKFKDLDLDHGVGSMEVGLETLKSKLHIVLAKDVYDKMVETGAVSKLSDALGQLTDRKTAAENLRSFKTAWYVGRQDKLADFLEGFGSAFEGRIYVERVKDDYVVGARIAQNWTAPHDVLISVDNESNKVRGRIKAAAPNERKEIENVLEKLKDISRIASESNFTETRGRVLNARIGTIAKTAVDHPKEAIEMIDQTLQFYKEQHREEKRQQPALRH